MSQNREIQFSAFIGIDWADRKHDISSDAALQVDFLMKHRDKLSPWFPDAPETRTLNRLVEMRRNLVHDKTRLTNKMTSLLKDYFPQVLELFSDKDTQVFCDFLLRWPTHKKAQRVRKKTLMNFLRSHNSYRSALFEKPFLSLQEALPITEDQSIIYPSELLIESLVNQLKPLKLSIAKMDKEIQQISHHHEDYFIFNSLPGAGEVFVPRLIAAFGSDRNRYGSANDLLKYAGIASVLERSGKKSWVHWRFACPKFLRYLKEMAWIYPVL